MTLIGLKLAAAVAFTLLPAPVRSAVAVPMAVADDAARCPQLLRVARGTLVSCLGLRQAELRIVGDGRTVVRFRPAHAGDPQLYTAAAVSPDGRWLLLAAAMPCDSRGAFVVPAAGGSPRLLPRLPEGCDASQAYPLGWTRDGRAVVAVDPIEACGCRLAPGAYVVDPGTRRGGRLWRGDVRKLVGLR